MTRYLYLSDYGNKFVSALIFSEQKRKTAMQVYEADNDYVYRTVIYAITHNLYKPHIFIEDTH